MRNALQPSNHEAAVTVRNEYRAGALSETHNRYFLPRIGSGVFASITAGLLAFSGSLKDNPVFGDFLQSRQARLMLLAAFIYSGTLFVMTWLLEQRDAARVEWLTTEAGMQRTLSKVLGISRHETGDFLHFRFSDYCRALSGRTPHGRPLTASSFVGSAFPFFGQGLSESSNEKLAKLHLEELERRGAIKKSDARRLDVTYEITPEVAQDLNLAPGSDPRP